MMYSALAIVAAFLIQTPNTITTLRGSGLEVTVNLEGWSQVEGPGVFHGNYVRLGQFNAPNAQVLSLLVDDPPNGVTGLEGICQHSQKSYAAGSGLKVLEAATVAGKPACMFTIPTAAGRRDFYVNMLFDGRWLELHYSALDGRNSIETGRQALETLVASLTARGIDNKATELPVADLGDAEVTLAQKAQGCDVKSQDFICRSLAAFKAGKRPSGRPEPVGIAGMSMPVVFGLVEMEAHATFIVVSDTGVRTSGFGQKLTKEQAKAADDVVRAVRAGRHPDDDNLLVAAARAEKRVTSAVVTERSLRVSMATTTGYVRETGMGIVYFSLIPGREGMILGVYPTP